MSMQASEVMDLRPQPQPPVIVPEEVPSPRREGMERVRAVLASATVHITQAMSGAVRAAGNSGVRVGATIARGCVAAARATWRRIRGARTILSSRGVAMIG